MNLEDSDTAERTSSLCTLHDLFELSSNIFLLG